MIRTTPKRVRDDAKNILDRLLQSIEYMKEERRCSKQQVDQLTKAIDEREAEAREMDDWLRSVS